VLGTKQRAVIIRPELSGRNINPAVRDCVHAQTLFSHCQADRASARVALVAKYPANDVFKLLNVCYRTISPSDSTFFVQETRVGFPQPAYTNHTPRPVLSDSLFVQTAGGRA